jgi:hypothetical protein
MGQLVDNSVLDAALAEIATAVTLTVTDGEPANFGGIAALAKGSYTSLTTGLGGADFSAAADGTTSGRKTTVSAQTGNNASASGNADHICLDDGAVLLYVTTAPAKTLTISEPFDTGAWDIEIQDPA